MKGTKGYSIDVMGKMLSGALIHAGWTIEVEDDYSGDFKHFCFKNAEGLQTAFTRFDLILMALNNDPANIEIRFNFFAEPEKIGSNKVAFGKKMRENNFATLRGFIEELMEQCNVSAKEEEIEYSSRPKCKIDFGNGKYVTPAHEVNMVYWKNP